MCRFVKRDVRPVFLPAKNQPRLLYVSEIRPTRAPHPRVMHAHADAVELILICSGSSEYLIHDKKVVIKAGDLLVYNAGVVHDEVSGRYGRGFPVTVSGRGLHMPGLRENALISDEKGYVFPTGRYFEDMKELFVMMFRNLAAGEPHAELFCSSLMHALLVSVLTVTEGVGETGKIRRTSRTSSAAALKITSTGTTWSRSRSRAWARRCASVRTIFPMCSSR